MAFAPVSITVETARRVQAEGLAAIRAGQTDIDLAGLTAVDSAAVSVLLSWLRAARAAGSALRFAHIPQPVHTLATLYGVDEFLA
ncbi:lipid asymmetry maintenance protein MlaB [Massilia sp. TS11]|uniref:STAS domain-containing protein n=1 Tax=Massilia sp. TS11 TaxID=2908003 RepID=UPI001EDBCCFE|nr:STAS domain-containing protein [Massilia sp. TS11]MCG2585116.1 STAS domain-containing protein [Massilia sp. TS11]